MRSRGAVTVAWRLSTTLLATALLIAGCADSTVPAAAPSHPQPTPAAQTKIFVPVMTSVRRTERGSCWTTSITVSAPSAYRCYAGNQILDPCFAASAKARDVTCYADPWSPGVRLDLASALPQPTPLAISHPWALELANGKRCVAATGVVNRIGNLALLYECAGGGAAGLPMTRDGHPTVEYVPAGAQTAVPVAVTVTWQA